VSFEAAWSPDEGFVLGDCAHDRSFAGEPRRQHLDVSGTRGLECGETAGVPAAIRSNYAFTAASRSIRSHSGIGNPARTHAGYRAGKNQERRGQSPAQSGCYGKKENRQSPRIGCGVRQQLQQGHDEAADHCRADAAHGRSHPLQPFEAIELTLASLWTP